MGIYNVVKGALLGAGAVAVGILVKTLIDVNVADKSLREMGLDPETREVVNLYKDLSGGLHSKES